MKPSIGWAYDLLEKEKVPPHIVRHSEKVALIALYLGCHLKASGEPLDIKTLTLGALLHDIKKFSSLRTGENHALAGYMLLQELGYPRIAEIIYSHIFLRAPKPGSPITEEEIVFYADKRVKHDQIVSLKERFKDLRERYGRTLKALIRMSLLEEMTQLLERRIFRNLSIEPRDLIMLNKIEEVRSVLEKAVEGCTDSWRNFFGEGGLSKGS